MAAAGLAYRGGIPSRITTCSEYNELGAFMIKLPLEDKDGDDDEDDDLFELASVDKGILCLFIL